MPATKNRYPNMSFANGGPAALHCLQHTELIRTGQADSENQAFSAKLPVKGPLAKGNSQL